MSKQENHSTHATRESSTTLIDPRAPRFGQLITATGLSLGIVLQEPLFIIAIAAILSLSVLSGWRVDLYQFLWRHAGIPLVGPPDETEPAAPHRFAKVLGATCTVLAVGFLFAAELATLPILAIAGYAVAGLVAVLAAVAGIGNYCLGCKMYTQVSLFRRLGIV